MTPTLHDARLRFDRALEGAVRTLSEAAAPIRCAAGVAVAVASVAITFASIEIFAGIFYVISLTAILGVGLLLGRGPGIAATVTSVAGYAASIAIETRSPGLLRADAFRFVGFLLFAGVAATVASRVGTLIVRSERARRAADEHSATLEAVFGAIADGLVMYGPTGEVLRMNASAEALLALRPATRAERPADIEILGADGRRLAPRDFPAARALRGETLRGVELLYTRPTDGERVWLSVTASPLAEGAVATFADVTRRHADEAHRADVIRALSHDVRTPLNVILTHAEMLEGDPGPSTGELQRRARAIATSAGRIAGMVNDVIDLAQLQTGRIRLQHRHTSLDEVLERVTRRISTALGPERLRVVAREPLPALSLDAERVERAILSLVEAALRSAPRGEVTLEAGARNGGVALTVHGIGTEELAAELPPVFVEGSDGAHAGGPGPHGREIGVFVARKLVEAHGGSVTLGPPADGGRAMTIVIPGSSA